MPLARLRAEERGEERDVLAPLGERRDADRQHLQSVEEVLAEAALGDRVLEVEVGRRDDAHVRALRLRAAERVVLLRLQEMEELRLRGMRELADLVEEERAALRAFDLALDAPRGRRVRTRERPEELALD